MSGRGARIALLEYDDDAHGFTRRRYDYLTLERTLDRLLGRPESVKFMLNSVLLKIGEYRDRSLSWDQITRPDQSLPIKGYREKQRAVYSDLDRLCRIFNDIVGYNKVGYWIMGVLKSKDFNPYYGKANISVKPIEIIEELQLMRSIGGKASINRIRANPAIVSLFK